MKIFTPPFFIKESKMAITVSSIVLALFLMLNVNVAEAQTQPTMAVRGDINSFGNSAMTYRSTLAQTWMATVQATATNSAAAFLFLI